MCLSVALTVQEYDEDAATVTAVNPTTRLLERLIKWSGAAGMRTMYSGGLSKHAWGIVRDE